MPVRILSIALVFAGAVGGSRLAAQADWAPVTRGQLAVSMPCTSNWQSEKDSDPQTGPSTTHLYLCRSGDEQYLAAITDYVEFRPEVARELNANRDNLITSLTGAVLSTSNRLTYEGLPALDFTANWQGRLVSGRIVIQGYRPFMLVVVTPLTQDRATNIGRFLSSMRITK
jgi:hypothetical protein